MRDWQSLKNGLHWLLLIFLLAGCGAGPAELACGAHPGCLRYGIAADIAVLDPHSSDAPEAGMIFRQIYDTLVYRTTDSHEFTPGLAHSWQVSADGLVYTFNLRSDVVFHDGSPFNAEAVARNIDRIFDADRPPARARDLLGPLWQYEIVDSFTIRLHFSQPHAALLDGLAQPHLGIASPTAFNEYDHLRYQFYQVGTGPFTLAEYLPGERVGLRRFADYRVQPAIYSPLAGGEIERVEFAITRAEEQDTLSLLAEGLAVLDNISPLEARALAGNSRVQLLPMQIPGQTAQVLFNTNRPPLNNTELRRALLLATNRVALSDEVYLNYSPVAWTPLSESTGYAHLGYVNQFAFDLQGAQALLAAAGYAEAGADGILQRDGQRLSLKIITPPWGRWPEMAAFLQREWRALGIELQIEPVPGRTRLEALIRSGEYDLLPIDNYGIDPALLGQVFLDSSSYRASWAGQANLQELLLAAAQTSDAALRRNQYYEIQALLMNEALILPLREYSRLTATRVQVQNLRFDAYGFYPLLFNTTIEAG